MQHYRIGLDRIVNFLVTANPVQRSAFLMVLITLLTIQYEAWALLVYYTPAAHDYVRPDIIAQHIPTGSFILIGCFLLYFLCRKLSHSNNPQTQLIIQTTVATFYALSMLFFGHLIGSMSMAAGIVFLGSPIFGLFLLESRAIYISLVIGMSTFILLCVLSAYQYIEYAPLLVKQNSLGMSIFWFWSLMYFTAPFWTVICVLCDRIMRNLRKREADIRYLAEHDTLTGLYNRRFIDQQTPSILKRAVDDGVPLSVIIVDLDYFKKVNDVFGHLCGDQVLVAAAQVLQENLRQNDLVGRFGGEEFIILMPNTSQEDAAQITERIRLNLQHLELYDQHGKLIPVSASFGLVSLCIQQYVPLNTLVHYADLALYRAKAEGRNRVVIYDQPIDLNLA